MALEPTKSYGFRTSFFTVKVILNGHKFYGYSMVQLINMDLEKVEIFDDFDLQIHDGVARWP